jgi:hypothetical protein
MYFFQRCLICRPSDSTVSKDAWIKPRTFATSALAIRCSNHSARSNPHELDLYHSAIGPRLQVVYIENCKYFNQKPRLKYEQLHYFCLQIQFWYLKEFRNQICSTSELKYTYQPTTDVPSSFISYQNDPNLNIILERLKKFFNWIFSLVLFILPQQS